MFSEASFHRQQLGNGGGGERGAGKGGRGGNEVLTDKKRGVLTLPVNVLLQHVIG